MALQDKMQYFIGFSFFYLICFLILPRICSWTFVDSSLFCSHNEDVGLKFVKVKTKTSSQTNQSCFLVSVFFKRFFNLSLNIINSYFQSTSILWLLQALICFSSESSSSLSHQNWLNRSYSFLKYQDSNKP